ncbi:ribonuclease P protein component [Buchananella felis]|uniref:ribonuclease P protein component n=1 Tax=Buchananella felis TaxID=3231492 RepID=UPI003528EE77
MLPGRHRMVRPEDFRAAARAGVTVRSADLIIHLADAGSDAARIGLVVPKKQIPLSSHRARVKRRLRHLCRELLAELGPAALLVLRVQSGADGLTSAELGEQLRAGVKRAKRKLAARQGEGEAGGTSATQTATANQPTTPGGQEEQ